MKNLLKAREKFGLTEFYCEDIHYGYLYKDLVTQILKHYGPCEIIKTEETRDDNGELSFTCLTIILW